MFNKKVFLIILLFGLIISFRSSTVYAITYSITDLGNLDDRSFDFAYDVNESGQVVGFAFNRSDSLKIEERAFLWEDGSMYDLGTLSGGESDESRAYAINDSGQIVGWSYSNDGIRAFIWDENNSPEMQSLGTFTGGGRSEAHDINNSGTITGYAYNSGGDRRAFLYDGTMSDLGTLGGDESIANGINSTDEIVGWSDNSSGDNLAFFYDGTMHNLGTLGGDISSAQAINDSGQIVGIAYDSSGNKHAFLYDGTMYDLGTLGGTRSEAYDINSSGLIVGTSIDDSDGKLHAFSWDETNGMQNLDNLVSGGLSSNGWIRLTYAFGVNDKGQIVGYGYSTEGTQAFLLTPIPEPTSLLLLGFGIMGLGLLKNNSQRVKIS